MAAVNAGIQKATELKLKMNVAVVDAGGNLRIGPHSAQAVPGRYDHITLDADDITVGPVAGTPIMSSCPTCCSSVSRASSGSAAPAAVTRPDGSSAAAPATATTTAGTTTSLPRRMPRRYVT